MINRYDARPNRMNEIVLAVAVLFCFLFVCFRSCLPVGLFCSTTAVGCTEGGVGGARAF